MTADDSVGAIRQNDTTFQTMSFSGDGVIRTSEEEQVDNYFELLKHVATPGEETGNQPVGWLRLTDQIKTWVIPVIFTQFSESSPYDDAVTYSLSAEVAASPIGVTLERTPSTASRMATTTTTPKK